MQPLKLHTNPPICSLCEPGVNGSDPLLERELNDSSLVDEGDIDTSSDTGTHKALAARSLIDKRGPSDLAGAPKTGSSPILSL